MLAQEETGLLKIKSMTAIFRLAKLEDNTRSIAGTFSIPCSLSVLDDQGRKAGIVSVDDHIAPSLENQKQKFLALSHSTLYRIDADPSWDDKTKSFRSWTHASGDVRGEDDEDKDDEDEFSIHKLWSDRDDFSARVFWPTVNVLLLSEPKNGVVERIGIGKIHVDAFLPIAKEECILLG